MAKHTQAAVKVEGTNEWVRTNRIVDPKVEEYGAKDSEEVKTPTKEILPEIDERLEKPPEILESNES